MNGKPALHNFVAIFADDFLIHSADMEEHLLHIAWVFKQFHKYQVTLSLKKAVFAKKEVTFLAHRIHTEPVLSIQPLHERCEAISEMEAPMNQTEVRRWLGVCSYYRRYIQDYSRIAAPVTALLKDDIEFEWTKECQESMDQFKKKLTSFPVNCVRDHSLPLIIRCDGSRTGVGAVLVQADRITSWMKKVLEKDNGQSGKELSESLQSAYSMSILEEEHPLLEKQKTAKRAGFRVLSYLSRQCTPAEQKWGTAEWECLALIYAISKFRHYLLGEPHFWVMSDHANLNALLKKKAEHSTSLRLTRWALILQEYRFSIVHTAGIDLEDADCLSRSPIKAQEGDEDIIRDIQMIRSTMPPEKPPNVMAIENGHRRILPSGMANMRANKEGQKYKAIHIAHGLSSEAMACEAEPISFVAGSDTDAICSELFTQRTGAIQLGDMKTIAKRIDEGLIKLDDIDLCCFSTPCQGLSVAHNFSSKPEENSESLFKCIPEIVRKIKPKCITIEQVRPLAKTIHAYEKIVQDLTEMGYYVQVRLVNTALYGSYTAKTRWICVADNLTEHVELPIPRTSFPGCREILVNPAEVPLHYRWDGPWQESNKRTPATEFFQSNMIGAIKKAGKGNRIYDSVHPAPTLTCSSSGWAGHGELILDNWGPRKWLFEELMRMHNITPTGTRQLLNQTTKVQHKLLGGTTPVSCLRLHMKKIVKALNKQKNSLQEKVPERLDKEVQVALIEASQLAPSLEEFRKAQGDDKSLSDLSDFLQVTKDISGKARNKAGEELSARWRKYWPHVYLDDQGILKIRSLLSRGEELVDRILVPEALENQVFKAYHEGQLGGHCGREPTLDRIRRIFLFPNMSTKIRSWVKACPLCAKAKAHRMTNTGASFSELYQEPWDKVGVDLVGPYTPMGKGGYRYILTFSCHYSRYMCLEPLKDKSALEVAKAFEKVIFRIGIPKAVVCDNGQEFIAQVFQAICDRLHIKKIHTSPHHPESNGACESSHREINKHLRLALQVYNRDWKEAVYLMEYVHNSTPLAGIAFCPFYLMYHRWPTQWQDLPLLQQKAPSKRRAEYDEYTEYITARLAEARTIMLNTQLRDKESRLIKSCAKRRDQHFDKDDEVLVWRPAAASTSMDKTSAKLLWAAVGPMRVIRYNGKNGYLVEHLSTGKRYRVNVRDMFPYCQKKKISEIPGSPPMEPPKKQNPDYLPLPNMLEIDLCAEGQWVAIPRERRWFLAKILSYDEGSDEVTIQYYNTHQKSGRQQLKPSWFHPGSEKEVFAAKKPKHYLAYTEVLERKLLYPRAVKVITRANKSGNHTHEVTKTLAKELQDYAEGTAVEVDEVRIVSGQNKKSYPQPFLVKSTAQGVRARKINHRIRAIKESLVTPPAVPRRHQPPPVNRIGREPDTPPNGENRLTPRGIEQQMTQSPVETEVRLLRSGDRLSKGGLTRTKYRKEKARERLCDHDPCQRLAREIHRSYHDAPEFSGTLDGMGEQWLCRQCATEAAIHDTPVQSPRGRLCSVWHQNRCDECTVETDLPHFTDLPPRTPRRRRRRPRSPEHSPDFDSEKKSKKTPGSNYLVAPGVRKSPRHQTCLLEGCNKPVETGVCQRTGKAKLACSKAHYQKHKCPKPRSRGRRNKEHKDMKKDHSLKHRKD
jgi:site-specific DNA-cytosine methylase